MYEISCFLCDERVCMTDESKNKYEELYCLKQSDYIEDENRFCNKFKFDEFSIDIKQ